MAQHPEIPETSTDDLARIHALLATIGGPHVVWGAAQTLEVWLVEQRLLAEAMASRRLLLATWILAAATVGLVAATVGLIVVA